MAAKPTISFNLPDGETVQVYLVRLQDGRVVSRTREELEELPPESGVQMLGPAPAEGKL